MEQGEYRMRLFSSMAILMLLITMVPMVFVNEAGSEACSESVPHDIQNTIMDRDHFVENLGQLSRDDISFYSFGDLRIGFTDSSMVYALGLAESFSYEIEFIESNDISPAGFEEDLTKYNFFYGSDETSWVTDASSFKTILYEDLWDDIDMKFYCLDGNLKYDIIVNPGADVSDIRFRVIGADISPSSDGRSIEFHTPIGDISDGGLVAFQDDLEVPVSFSIEGKNFYSFVVEEYDREKVLVIDPLITSLSYLGGTQYDYASRGFDQHNGNIIASGTTGSTDFPTTPGAYERIPDPNYSTIFITKFNTDLSDLIFSTFIDGSSWDEIVDIAVDGYGDIYVTGVTQSKDFPTTSGAMNETSKINDENEWRYYDSFLSKISSSGNSLVYSTFIGGSDSDGVSGVEVDSSGCAFIAGETESRDFYVKNGYDEQFDGDSDFFIMKMNPQGSAPVYSTFLGGSDGWGEGYVYNLKVDSSGRAVVVGTSSTWDFPTTPGSYKPSTMANSFISRLSTNGDSLDTSTFLENSINPNSLVLLDDGIFIGGVTYNSALPITSNAISNQLTGRNDGFLMKFDIGITTLQYCSYIGGSGSSENIIDMNADSDSRIYLIGLSDSSDLDTTPGAVYTDHQGNSDAFFCRLNDNLTSFDIMSYFGGSGNDEGYFIHPYDEDNLFIAGRTTSNDLPWSENAYDKDAGQIGLFAGKIKLSSYPPTPPMNLSIERYDSQVNLSWDPPLHDGNETVLNYTIYMSSTNISFDEIGRVETDDELVFIKDYLDNGMKYYFYITARNIVGESFPSRIVNAVPARPPSIPELQSLETWNGTVELHWDVPSDHGGDRMVFYNVYSGSHPDELVRIASRLDSLDFEHTGLINGQTYYYSISAGNSMGEGDISTPFYAVPLTTPYFPMNLTFERGSEFVHLHWEGPYDDGGDDEITFNIYMKKASTLEEFEQIAGGRISNSYNMTRLTNGLTYEFKIIAVNSRGEGPFSEKISATPIGIPDEPLDLEAEFSDSRVDLEWEPPRETGGDSIRGYNVYQKWENDDPVLISSSLTRTYLVLTDLENGDSYKFYVTALNTLYESRPSEIVYGIPIGQPDQPTGLKAEFGDSRVVLTWLEPGYDGGSRISSYEVFMGTRPDDLTKMSETTITSHTETGLTNGKTYYFAVRAFNELMMGKLSDLVSATPITTPDQPSIFYYKALDSSVELRWNPPAQAVPDPNITYNIYIGSEGDPFHLLIGGLNITEYLIEDLDNGEIYTIGISVTNRVGEGYVSETVKLMPVGPPPNPLTLNITRMEGSLDLSWTLPYDQGGSPIVEVQIYRWLEGKEPILLDKVDPSLLVYRDITAENGKNYNYMIKGRSEIGLTPDSNVVAGKRVEEDEGIDVASIAFISIAILLMIIVIIVILMVVGTRRSKQPEPLYAPPRQMYAPPPPQGYVSAPPPQQAIGPAPQTQQQLEPGSLK